MESPKKEKKLLFKTSDFFFLSMKYNGKKYLENRRNIAFNSLHKSEL